MKMQLCGREIGPDRRIFVIAGPCAIESEALALATAEQLGRIAERLDLFLIYKSSFDKANRSSDSSFRGPGLEEGLRILEKVRNETGLPVLTDIHTEDQVSSVADVVDVLQTPAFLARQTDFIAAVAKTGKPVNIKKAQFMAPGDMKHVVAKARNAAQAARHPTDNFLVCERGASFGYNNLVSDMRSLAIMRDTDCPVVFDATHSVQLPGGQGDRSGGQREFVPVLARAAVAAGISGLFMETHPDPDQALSDGPNAWPLDALEPLLEQLMAIDQVVKFT
jgi:2-dehydro-3-deoxyphosphooctonate aldolase (KDO 8-P synthase)